MKGSFFFFKLLSFKLFDILSGFVSAFKAPYLNKQETVNSEVLFLTNSLQWLMGNEGCYVLFLTVATVSLSPKYMPWCGKTSSKHYIWHWLKNELIMTGLKKGGKETLTYKSLAGKFTKLLCHLYKNCILIREPPATLSDWTMTCY